MRHDGVMRNIVSMDESEHFDIVEQGTMYQGTMYQETAHQETMYQGTMYQKTTYRTNVDASADEAQEPASNPDFIDVEAEYRLLASLIYHPNYLFSVSESLFTGYRCRVFRALRSIYQRYGVVVMESVEAELGSVPQQLIVARVVPPQPLIDYLANLLLRREITRIVRDLTDLNRKPNVELSDVMTALSLRQPYTRRDGSLVDGIDQLVTSITARKNGVYRYLDTGIPFLNTMLDGEWPRSALSVVMGQAGGGKTALICQSALSMARMGIPVIVFSLEMPKDKLILRFLSHLTSIPAHVIKNGSFSDPRVIDDALSVLQTLPLYVIADVGMTVEDIMHYIELYVDTKDVQAFFVDYLQIITPPTAETMFESLGIVTQRLRDTAVKRSIAGIVLSQQNRQFSGLDSLLGSSRIAHISDVVIEIKMDTQTIADLRPVRLIFHKNREGRVGESACLYNAPILRFE